MMRRLTPVRAVLLAALLAGCGGPVREPASRAPQADLPATGLRQFGAEAPTPPQRPNPEMAQDFIDLAFRLESGRDVPVLTRFEGPVRVRMTGPVPPTAARDLDRLVARLRAEAGIDIARTDRDSASITVEFLPRQTMRALVPSAACFVAPRVTSWGEYRAARRSSRVDWTALDTRTTAAVFIPSDTSPQEVRDCLHEEIAQALGPLNDLYRLPDSIFNDDNIHGVLTGFDMLMLRTYYAPELASGMTRGEVAAAVPAILARLNPRGQRPGGRPSPTPEAFVAAIETVLGPRASLAARRSAAARATEIAEGARWNDVRTGFAWFLRGRLLLASDPQAAYDALLRAQAVYAQSPTMALHAAHLDMHLAAFALSQGNAEEALARASRAMEVAYRGENAALLASLMLIRAEALEIEGRPDEARAVRLDSLAWARYGLGSDAEIRRRMDEIAALSPRRRSASR